MQIGTDIIEIKRVKDVYMKQKKFARRILSDAEYEAWSALAHPERQMTFLAGRFAAKEAYGKAMGTGIGTLLSFSEIVIMPHNSGQPYVVAGPICHPQAKVTISHSTEYATATVLLEPDDSTIEHLLNTYLENKGVLSNDECV